MAEVANLRLPNEPTVIEEELEQEQEEDTETLDSVSHWCSNTTFDTDCDCDCDHDYYASDSDPFSPHRHHLAETVVADHLRSDSDSYSDSDTESGSVTGVNCFVTDLFEQHRSEQFHVMDDLDSDMDPFSSDLDFRFFEGSDEIGANGVEEDELELGLEFGIEFDRPDFVSGLGESSGIREPNSRRDGLRVVGIGSDSDSEVVGADLNSRDYGDDGDGSDRDIDLDLPLCWDCLRLEDRRTANDQLLVEWEEVDELVDEREGLSMVIDGVEELSVSSEISSEEGADDGGEEAAARNLEWEVLLAVNNFDINPDFEHDGDGDANSYLAVQDDYFYAAEYETLFGQFVESESALKGSPPAAKTVVENLPVVALTQEDLQKDNVVCAVCRDEILLEEKVKRLPCCHYYHGDCIVPWLSIRNTCPVCRYELPTDDPDYERRKSQRAGHGLSQDLQAWRLNW